MHIARIARVPDAADANLRLVHVLLLHTSGVQHGLRSALTLWLCDIPADFVQYCVVLDARISAAAGCAEA